MDTTTTDDELLPPMEEEFSLEFEMKCEQCGGYDLDLSCVCREDDNE